MAVKEKVKEKEYQYILVVKCVKCETVSIGINPCEKCGGIYFKRVYEVQEK